MKLKFKGKSINLENKKKGINYFESYILDYVIDIYRYTEDTIPRSKAKWMCNVSDNEYLIIDKEYDGNKEQAVQMCLDEIEKDIQERKKNIIKEIEIIKEYDSM